MQQQQQPSPLDVALYVKEYFCVCDVVGCCCLQVCGTQLVKVLLLDEHSEPNLIGIKEGLEVGVMLPAGHKGAAGRAQDL